MSHSRIIFSMMICCLLVSFAAYKKPNLKSAKKVLSKLCVEVPAGKAVIHGDSVSLESFYISKGEVTNIQYQEFLADLKREGKEELYQIAKVDNEKWNSGNNYHEPYATYYHIHPAYDNYPVVNITKEGAALFCEWLTEKYDSLSGGELTIEFRIPTYGEWMRAARGDHHKYVYSWGGPYLRGSNGTILANHLLLGGGNIHRNDSTGRLEIVVNSQSLSLDFLGQPDITSPSISYYPNDFGIYNMNGNVAEMVSDQDSIVGGSWRSPGYDIRNESCVLYKGAEPTVGFRIVASKR